MKTVRRKPKITARERHFMEQYAPSYADGAPTKNKAWLMIGCQRFVLAADFSPREKQELEWLRWQLAKALIVLVDAEKENSQSKG